MNSSSGKNRVVVCKGMLLLKSRPLLRLHCYFTKMLMILGNTKTVEGEKYVMNICNSHVHFCVHFLAKVDGLVTLMNKLDQVYGK